ncbi:MAG TPA: hypothetical protein VNQ32_10915 [Steroidobacteraceae bacterium]|nr:hypothetical protein [Steroidobacteraceae bacterium]
MILSHDDTNFPYRRQLLTAVIGLLAIVSVVAPSDDWLQRVVAPFKVILIGAMAYGVVLLFLHLFAPFAAWFAKLYALFCYYIGILGLVLTPILTALDARSGPPAIGSAEYFSAALPSMAAGVFAAAAGYNWLRSAHVA